LPQRSDLEIAAGVISSAAFIAMMAVLTDPESSLGGLQAAVKAVAADVVPASRFWSPAHQGDDGLRFAAAQGTL
jgi:hypothetical protein